MSDKKSETGASVGKEIVLKKLQEAVDFIKSENVAKVISLLNASSMEQLGAMTDLNKFLAKNGIKLPPGLTIGTEMPSEPAASELKAKIHIGLYKVRAPNPRLKP